MRRGVLLSVLAALVVTAIGGATPATAGGYHVEYAFQGGVDGAQPLFGLLGRGGKLYGTTPSAGQYGVGVVYSFDPKTGPNTVVYAFKGNNDGVFPYGELIDFGGKLYGTTSIGGPGEYGTVFSVDPATGLETVVYAFEGGADGYFPVGGMTKIKGILYGTTLVGGQGPCENGCGTVFSFNPETGAEAVVYSFGGGADGATPYGGVTDVKGLLYGTTNGGGSTNCSQGCGTVFQVDPTNGKESILHAFMGGSDGESPLGNLTKVNGIVYGTTTLGGTRKGCERGCGTVFSLNPATGLETVVHAFKAGHDGLSPVGNVTAVGETLYGVTEYGGAYGDGTVFELDLASGAEKVLHSFQGGSDGAKPYAGMTYKGLRLYGTTYNGGGSVNCNGGCGTVFSIRPYRGQARPGRKANGGFAP